MHIHWILNSCQWPNFLVNWKSWCSLLGSRSILRNNVWNNNHTLFICMSEISSISLTYSTSQNTFPSVNRTNHFSFIFLFFTISAVSTHTTLTLIWNLPVALYWSQLTIYLFQSFPLPFTLKLQFSPPKRKIHHLIKNKFLLLFYMNLRLLVWSKYCIAIELSQINKDPSFLSVLLFSGQFCAREISLMSNPINYLTTLVTLNYMTTLVTLN